MPPLPHYVNDWPGEARRVSAGDLDGVQYDRTIQISAIFWLKKPGESNPKLVVRSRCRNCHSQNLPCIRRDPCNSCRFRRLRCTYPKYPMNLPKTRVIGPPNLMIAPLDDEPACEKNDEDVEEDAPEGIVEQDIIAEASYLMPRRLASNGKYIPIHNGKPLKLLKRKDAPDASNEHPKGQTSSKRRRLRSDATTKKDKISWTKIDMNKLNEELSADRITTPRLPYIWSGSYAELLGGVPFLSVMSNGVSADIGPSPMIFVDDAFWSGTWSGTNVLQLTTTRIFACSESALKPITKQIDGSAVGSRATAIEELNAFHLLSIAGEEDSYSDMEFVYPDEHGGCEASSTNERFTMTPPLHEHFQEASITENDPKDSSTDIELSSSFPPRLNDDSVRMYLFPSTASPTAKSTACFEEAPEETLPSFEENQGPNSIAYAPEGSPDEIAILYKAYEGGMPVSVIADTTWKQFPFDLHQKCRYAVLGYFHIINVETSVEPMDPIAKKNGLPRARGQTTWTFSLRWTPGGPLDPDIPIDVDGRPQTSPLIPWWISPECDLVPSTSFPSTIELIEPHFVRASILAWTIMRDAYEGGTGRANASHRTWLCVKCGKLNVTNWIGAYTCSFCISYHGKTTLSPAKLVHATSVRDKLRLLPMWEPSTQIPDWVVTEMAPLENQLRRFTYTLSCADQTRNGNGSEALDPSSTSPDECVLRKLDKGKGKAVDKGKGKGRAIDAVVDKGVATDRTILVVELLFLGNRVELEKEADTLFTEFQRDVSMRFESTESKATAGVFTFMVSPDGLPQAEGCSNWISAPVCIKKAREKMIDYVDRYAKRDVRHTLSHLSAMAWLGESPVKTEIQANARVNPVMLMCLGADLDIIFSKPGEERQQKKLSKSKSKASKGRSKAKEGVDEDMQEEQNQISRAGIREEIWGDGEGRETNKALTASDRLRITLTHGSILVISGRDINLTVIRSDFAILKWYHGL